MSKVYVALDGTEFSTKEDALEYQELCIKAGNAFAEKRKEFLLLQEAANKAVNAVYRFQEECPHEYVTRKARSDTGNYDPSQASLYIWRCINNAPFK
jgi:hypothetical protein